uniref:Transposase domain-containing protein n=1 Tax=Schizaphis graminum TaxID=13262 RepID=A0A2S2NV11_SCHGA
MPKPFSKFHQLSNRSKRRRLAENKNCLSDHCGSSDTNNSSNDDNNKQLNTSNEQDVLNAPINSLNQTLSNCTDQSVDNDEYEKILSSTSSGEHNIIDEDVLLDFDSNNLFLRQFVDHSKNDENSIKNFLRVWAVKHNITASALSELLVGLKKNIGNLSDILPSDSRTLLKTSIVFEKKTVEPGHYIHFGLEIQLKRLISSYDCNVHELYLLINIDGLPLFKSSPGQAIPILVSIVNVPELQKIVFPIGLYYGYQKPKEMDNFLTPFVLEIIELSERGILTANGTNILVKILGFVCDAPAKKDILGIKGHGGYYSCTRCTVRGTTLNNKRVFTDINCPTRTSDDFINWIDPNYRLVDTCLVKIPGIDFVHSIILDIMHLVYLGVMRTMLLTWYDGDLPFKLSRLLVQRISDFMCSARLPVEFVRKPRELKYLLRWKAVEYRSFLLYLGPVALKGILDQEKYNNFMTLNVAISILLNQTSIQNHKLRDYSRELLRHFVQSFMILYHPSFITHNFHNLIHLVDDADYFAPIIPMLTLDTISAFPYENYLQQIKRMTRGKNKPLEQIGNRMAELLTVNSTLNPQTFQKYPICSKMHCNGPLIFSCINPQYSNIQFSDFKIKISSPDNCCGSASGDIIMVDNICFSQVMNSYVIIGRMFLRKKNFYSIPCESSSIGVYEVEKLSEMRIWPVDKIVNKYVFFSHKNAFIVFPLLHSNK